MRGGRIQISLLKMTQLGSFLNFKGIRINIVNKPYISVFFQGCVDAPPPPSESAHVIEREK